jgi:hypothetical protein
VFYFLVNYLKHYVKLIRKAEQRGWTKKSAPCYVEKHHPFIQAVFGENNRVVYLTAREHVVAHLLLFKAYLKRYGRHHWKTWKVAGAATAMQIIGERHWGRTPVSCSTLGLAREVDAENKRIAYTGTTLPPRPGYKWYNNGVTQTRSKTHPGEGWVEGRIFFTSIPYEDKVISEETMSTWVENGRKVGLMNAESGQWESVRCKDGRGGAAGKGSVWWTNGVSETRAKECPGEGWVRGRLKRIK